MMLLESAWGLALSGVVCGTLLGAVSRAQHFCTLGSLERFWYANDSRGIRIWALAIAVALLSTQLLQHVGLINIQKSFLVSAVFNLQAAVIGGLMFGFGMALVGTCSFGALVRLGGGSIRSLIVIVTMGLAALAAQRGLLGPIRQRFTDFGSVNMPNNNQALPDLISSIFNANLNWLIILVAVIAITLWVFREISFRRDVAAIFCACVIGGVVSAGWFITSYFERTLFEPVQIESASFVAPPGDVLLSLIARTGGIPDYAMGLTFGVVLGAAIVAFVKKDVRWEACDSAQELGRHLLGAVMMGIGGVLANGCTIGQGVSAASLLTLSAPLVLLGIYFGAKLGLSFLMGGFSFALRSQ